MIKTVIFDIDGTMYDYEAGNRAGIAAVERCCRELTGIGSEEFHRLLEEAEQTLIARIGYGCASTHNRLIRYQCLLERLGQPVFPHAMNLYHAYWDALLGGIRAYPGLLAWLRQLKQQGIGIGVGTNMTALMQYEKLRLLEVDTMVDWIVTSEEAGAEKPDPRVFELCLQKSGCLAGECLFVGDSPGADARGAADAGMKALVVGSGDNGYPGILSYQECLAEGFLENFA